MVYLRKKPNCTRQRDKVVLANDDENSIGERAAAVGVEEEITVHRVIDRFEAIRAWQFN